MTTVPTSWLEMFHLHLLFHLSRYAPLVLPAVLNAIPSKYSVRIKNLGSDEEFIAEKHVDQFNDFIDREEVDH